MGSGKQKERKEGMLVTVMMMLERGKQKEIEDGVIVILVTMMMMLQEL